MCKAIQQPKCKSQLGADEVAAMEDVIAYISAKARISRDAILVVMNKEPWANNHADQSLPFVRYIGSFHQSSQAVKEQRNHEDNMLSEIRPVNTRVSRILYAVLVWEGPGR